MNQPQATPQDNNKNTRGPRRSLSLPVNSLPDDALVDIRVVSDVVGLKTTAIYARIKNHTFPNPERFGTRCTRFRVGKLRRWLADPMNYREAIYDRSAV